MKLSLLGKNLILLVFSLFCVSGVAHAGGPIGSMYADSQGWSSDGGYGAIIRFYLGLGTPCPGTQVTFKFTDSQPGDYIMTSSGNDTVTMDNSCGVYAKVASKNTSTRYVTATVKANDKTYTDPYVPTIKVDFDGQYHPDNSYNGYSYRSSVEDPYNGLRGGSVNPTVAPLPTIQEDITVWLLDQRYDKGVNKYGGEVATIKWTAVNVSGYQVLYDIYVTDSAGNTSIRQSEYGPSAMLYLDNTIEYQVKVRACISKVGNCKDSNTIVIHKIATPTKVMTAPSITSTPVISGAVTPTTKQNTDQLNQKITDLQKQLDESKQKQSSLEQKLANLLSFIKKLFPFFK